MIWYEDHNELPKLITKVFRLGYKSLDTNKLLTEGKDKISRIKKIEDDLSKYKIADTDLKVMAELKAYSESHSKEYRSLISVVGSILKELQARIPNNFETAMRFHTMEVPDYSNSKGFGDFFQKIYDVLSTLLKKNSSI